MFNFFACKKDDLADSNNITKTADGFSEKVKIWLDKQKSTYKQQGARTTLNKDAIIDLVEDNLVFGEASIEDINDKIKYLCIPIKDTFLEMKNLDRNATLAFLGNIDSTGNINAGGLVYFLPSDGKKHNSFPKNTFRNMFNRGTVELDGRYKMLTVSGRWISQFEIKDGKLHATGVVQKKENAGNSTQRTNQCIIWYLVTTIRWPDGTTTIIEDYVGTTCGTECEDIGSPGGCGEEDGGGGNYGVNADEELSRGGSTMDPEGSNTLPYNVGAHVWATYMSVSKIIVSVVPQKPYMIPPSQYFVDYVGNLAQASATVDNNWQFTSAPTMGGLQAYVIYSFLSRWYYTYSTGTYGPFTFQEGLTKFVGPF